MRVDLRTRFWNAITRAFQCWSRALRRFAERLDAPPRQGTQHLQPAIELVRAHPGHPGIIGELPGDPAAVVSRESPAFPLPHFERDEEDLLPHGDFSGADEEERFAALPPIPPDAVDDVDWDALARALTRNA